MGFEDKIENIEMLTGVFGRFPSFHDAEVLEVKLSRNHPEPGGPNLEASIYVFEMTTQVDETGHHIQQNRSILTLVFEEVYNIDLRNFNHQNVLMTLKIDYVSDDSGTWWFEVLFDAIFGVAAEFVCRAIRVVSVEPA